MVGQAIIQLGSVIGIVGYGYESFPGLANFAAARYAHDFLHMFNSGVAAAMQLDDTERDVAELE